MNLVFQLVVFLLVLFVELLVLVPHVALLSLDKHLLDAAPNFKSLGINPKNIALVRQGMNAVSNEAGGTAFRARINIPGMELSSANRAAAAGYFAEALSLDPKSAAARQGLAQTRQ